MRRMFLWTVSVALTGCLNTAPPLKARTLLLGTCPPPQTGSYCLLDVKPEPFCAPGLTSGATIRFPYELPGSLPAGTYRAHIDGFQGQPGGALHVELIHEAAGGRTRSLAAADATLDVSVPDGVAPDAATDVELTLAAEESVLVGDRLVLSVTSAASTAPFLDLFVELDTP